MSRTLACVATTLLPTACTPQTYACESTDQCNGGVCQPTGFCSFPDPSCESGQRYGEFAPSGLSRNCVSQDGVEATTQGVETTLTTEGSTFASEATSSEASDSGEGTTLALDDDGTSSTSNAGLTTTSTGEASSSSTGETQVDPDLVAWWRLEEDPESGVLDTTANRLHGSCISCPTSVPGVDGNGLSFSGEEVITVEDTGPFETPEFTIAAWARIEAIGDPTSYQHIMAKPVGSGSRNSWELLVESADNVQLQFVVANEQQTRVTAVPVPELGEWFHVAGTYDGATLRLYLDGVFLDDTAGPQAGILWTDNPVVIGGDNDHGILRASWIGDLDDLRVYGRALDDGELAALAVPP